MATLEQTIRVILTGEENLSGLLGKAGSGVESFGGKLSGLNDSIADVTQPFADLAGGVLKADAALTTLAVGGLVYAFNESKKFETATVELKKVVGDIPEDLAAATDNAKALSDTYGEASTSILLSTASFKQAGYDIEDSMSLAKNALDLVIAGNVEASQASELLISTLKGFDAPASEATRLIDILNEVSNNYATDVEQLAIGMAELSPIASTMGYSFEETAGILTPVIEIFRSGGEAAVALKTGLLRLVDDNKSVTDALKSIGVAQKDANGNLRSGKDILFDVATAFQTLDQNQKLFVASQLVGVEQSARMVTVFDNLTKSTEITATALNSAGSAAAEVDARLKSSEVAVNRFIVGFKNLSVAVGDEFRDAAKEAINGGTDIENALTKIIESGTLDDLFNALEKELNSLGKYLTKIAENLPEALSKVKFDGFLSSLGDLKNEVGDLFDGIDLSTPEGLAKAIQLVVNAVEGLTNVTSGMVSGARPFIDMLSNMVQEFIDLDSESQKTSGEVLGFAGALNKVTGPIGSVLKAVEGLGTGIQVLAGVQVANLVKNLVGAAGLKSALSGAATAASALAGNLANPANLTLYGSLAIAVGATAKAYFDWQDAEKVATEASKRAAESAENLADKYRQISEATGVQIETSQEFHQAIKDGQIVFDEATRSWQAGIDVQRDYEAEVRAVAAEHLDLEDVWDQTRRSLAQIGLEFDEAGNRINVATAEVDQFGSVVRQELGMARETISGTFSVVKYGGEEASKALKKANEDSDKFHETMLKLASDERIKTMELSVDLQLAQLEADSKTAQALIDGVGTSVESTSDLLGGLTDNLLSATNFSDKWRIEDLIDAQVKNQEDALQLQAKLTEAQISLIDARADAIKRGDGQIKVSMDGAMPELEAFVWKLMEYIQIRATELESNFLLGVGV